MNPNTNEQSAGAQSAFEGTPLRAVEDRSHGEIGAMILDSEGATVAVCWQCGDEGSAMRNARAFAAAPELLEALKLLARLEPECDDDDALLIAARAQAFAAITKATGHTP